MDSSRHLTHIDGHAAGGRPESRFPAEQLFQDGAGTIRQKADSF